jgi:hypothetical protein
MIKSHDQIKISRDKILVQFESFQLNILCFKIQFEIEKNE